MSVPKIEINIYSTYFVTVIAIFSFSISTIISFKANQVLPPDCMHSSDCLPTLISIATSSEGSKERRQ